MGRFLVRPGAVDRDHVRFDAAETRHLARVLRLGPGAVVEVVDGTGRAFTVRLDTLTGGRARGTILGALAPVPESPCRLTLGQALLKGERLGWLIQKATELGVTRIVLLQTARVVARPVGERGGAQRARWERVARAAVKQCGRAVVPAVEGPRALADLLAEARQHDGIWLLHEGPAGVPLARAAREARGPRRLLLLVGPEGGFSDEEVRQGVTAGARVVSLGPRIVRAESAGLAALVLCQHLFGDLGSDSFPGGNIPPG
jgi:16S rRNA (uracil1498-N3)-methyltransferase